MTEEEKLLLEVIRSDSTTIAATLKKLLHCGKKQLNMKSSPTSLPHKKMITLYFILFQGRFSLPLNLDFNVCNFLLLNCIFLLLGHKQD